MIAPITVFIVAQGSSVGINLTQKSANFTQNSLPKKVNFLTKIFNFPQKIIILRISTRITAKSTPKTTQTPITPKTGNPSNEAAS